MCIQCKNLQLNDIISFNAITAIVKIQSNTWKFNKN